MGVNELVTRTPPALRTSDFNYDLPPELIAQTPVEPRDSSRLLVLDRSDGSLRHHRFSELGGFLKPGDLLVSNDSRVIPARLRGVKKGTGGAVELLLLHRDAPNVWQALVRPGRRLGPGTQVELRDREGRIHGVEVGERLEGGSRVIHFENETTIEACGLVPLPPYIHEPLADPERYQTVYARVEGSAAAPTAGLHFTPDLLARLKDNGVGSAFVTLHTGMDTFMPVKEEDPRRHLIHREFTVLPEETARQINETRTRNRRIVCIGTTSARVLETAASKAGKDKVVAPYAGWTDLLILPGRRFEAIDILVTNFHLPRTTLLMLVSAFASKELIDKAYAEAVRERYRFYSFGDAMLIL